MKPIHKLKITDINRLRKTCKVCNNNENIVLYK